LCAGDATGYRKDGISRVVPVRKDPAKPGSGAIQAVPRSSLAAKKASRLPTRGDVSRKPARVMRST